MFRRDRIELVECKPLSWLESQLALPDSLWIKQGAVWTYSPYAEWAKQHGLVFRVWVSPTPTDVYLQNLEACYAAAGDALQRHESTTVSKAAGLIAKRPILLDSLLAEVPGFTPGLALWMPGESAAFGPWRSTPAGRTDRFHLYGTREQAKEADERLLRAIVKAQSQPVVDDPLLPATATDLQRAHQRLSRLALIEAGSLPLTRRMDALQRQVRKAVAEGRSAPSACLTKHAFSGNRASRLRAESDSLLPSKQSTVLFYIGIDGVTGYPMAHPLVFGSARTDALSAAAGYARLPRTTQYLPLRGAKHGPNPDRLNRLWGSGRHLLW